MLRILEDVEIIKKITESHGPRRLPGGCPEVPSRICDFCDLGRFSMNLWTSVVITSFQPKVQGTLVLQWPMVLEDGDPKIPRKSSGSDSPGPREQSLRTRAKGPGVLQAEFVGFLVLAI